MGITYSEEQKRLIAAARGGDLARLQELIDSGFDVDCELKYGASALLLAAGRGEAEVIRMLIKAGAKVNRRNKFGDTPLLEAVQRGFPEVVKILVEAGAEINIPHGNGNTAIFAATVRRDRRMVKLLLELGADPDQQNFEGWSAKKWAEAETDATIQAVFGIKKVDSESVSIKMQSEVTNNNNTEQPAKPPQTSAVEGAFWTVFMRAASAGDTSTVRQLALDGVEVNGQSPNGTTALMAAVKNGHAETAFELVELGADLSLTDIDGISAIDWAKKKGQVMIVEGLEKLSDITGQARAGARGDKSQESGAFQKSI
jgi:ankyrin repeat protein